MRRRPLPVLIALALVAGGCGVTERDATPGTAPAPAPPPPPGPAGDGSSPLVLVLPAPTGLHPAEHARLLVAADRALTEAAVDGPVRRVVLPRDGALADVVAAVAPGAGALCAVGAGAVSALVDVRSRRPELRLCAAPAPADPTPTTGVTGSDPDLAGLGVRLGTIARTAAGDGVVVVVASGDPLLGPTWTSGVVAGATSEGIDLVRVVGGAEALAAVLATGTAGAVVLDAGPASAAALAALAASDAAVVLPAALADAPGGPDPARIAARYRVRWDLVLTPLLRRVRGAAPVGSSSGTTVEVEPGPAARSPADRGAPG